MVATPIGNLGDITYRAIKILKKVDLIAAEDTRRARILLQKYNIQNKLISFHAQSSDTKIREILAKVNPGQSLAYISDAGTPSISAPGFSLVASAVRENFKIIPLPGPSALTALVSVAGVPSDKFVFWGFLPHKKGRQTIIKSFSETKISQIFYESVHRFPRLLSELQKFLGEKRVIVVGRELTKIYEEIFRGNVGEAMKYFVSEKIRGEFVVLVAPQNFSLKKLAKKNEK